MMSMGTVIIINEKFAEELIAHGFKFAKKTKINDRNVYEFYETPSFMAYVGSKLKDSKSYHRRDTINL